MQRLPRRSDAASSASLLPARAIIGAAGPHLVCLECGYRAQVLRRHLRVAHDLEVADYRTRWKLPPDHPVTAPSYSARRSTMAKQLGLGRKPSTVDASPARSGTSAVG